MAEGLDGIVGKRTALTGSGLFALALSNAEPKDGNALNLLWTGATYDYQQFLAGVGLCLSVFTIGYLLEIFQKHPGIYPFSEHGFRPIEFEATGKHSLARRPIFYLCLLWYLQSYDPWPPITLWPFKINRSIRASKNIKCWIGEDEVLTGIYGGLIHSEIQDHPKFKDLQNSGYLSTYFKYRKWEFLRQVSSRVVSGFYQKFVPIACGSLGAIQALDMSGILYQ